MIERCRARHGRVVQSSNGREEQGWAGHGRENGWDNREKLDRAS